MKIRHYIKDVFSTFVIIFCFLFFSACESGRNRNTDGIKDTITTMQKNRLRLSLDRMAYCIPDNDTARTDKMDAEYKLVVYVDSALCSPCIINKMFWWNDIIDLTRKGKDNVDYIFIFETRHDQIEDAHFAAESSGLKNRLYLDTACVFRAENSFLPNDDKYHTVMINSKDSIVMVGSPLTSRSIRKVFLQILNTGNS